MRQLFAPALAGLCVSWAIAASGGDSQEQVIRTRLSKTFPDNQIGDVRSTPMKGVFEVSIGSEIGYVTEDGKYLLHGDLIELASQKNLTETRREGLRKQLVDQIGEKNMIVFSPKKAKHTITVFTDIDCGYCRLLHKEIDGYQKEGIAVRYVFFPRAGLNSESSRKADSVWCAKDRREALTKAKQGETLPNGTCKTPVAAHYQTGMDAGVRGTPAIITEDGRMIPGYKPPAEMRKALDQQG
jgi:thiol:disulfide interchange protein DsbC